MRIIKETNLITAVWLTTSSVVFFNTLNTISNQHIWKFNQHGWKALDCTGTGCILSMACNFYLLNDKSIDGDMWVKGIVDDN